MKIRPRLEIHFVASIIVLATLLTVFFSVLTLEYFFQGIDRGQAQTMSEFVNLDDIEDGHARTVLGYHIASRWEDTPAEIQEAFEHNEPRKLFKLEKHMLGSTIFFPPKMMFLVMKATNSDNQVRYISKVISNEDLQVKHGDKDKPIPHVVWVALVGVSAIVVFTFILFLLIKKVASPVEDLKNWAKSLDEEKLQQPTPDFQYGELNTLANIIKTSLSSVQESLQREQQFLAHASHELRTPISVVRANSELLTKIYEREKGSPKQLAIADRINRAGKTMANLTETLLWLSRDDLNLPDSEKVDLQKMIQELVGELTYLLNNKPVTYEVETTPYMLNIAAIPCRIVLANLIRNAFQHTMEGKVIITQSGDSVSIVNTSLNNDIAQNELGFGLGLRLTQKLAERYRWHYSDQVENDEYKVMIKLESSPN